MPIVFDSAGRLVPPGKVARSLEETFILGAMPSWLTASSGTASYGAQASTRGYLQMTTGAVSGNAATVKTNFTVNLADQKAILWEASGLVLDSSTVQLAMGISNTGSVGSFIKQDSADSTLFVAMAGNSTAVPYNLRNGSEATRRRNLGIMLLPSTREMYVFEDDQVMAYRTHTSLTLGAVSCDLTVTTREAVAHNFQVQKLKITLFND